MSQILNRNLLTAVPNNDTGGGSVTLTLNATGETVCMVGCMELENPLSTAKTLSAAGGGSIVWRAGAATFANAGSTFDIGVQDVSTVSAPAQGDGTFDVQASYTGGGGGITTSAVNTSVMNAGSKSISHNQLIAITFKMTALGGADSVAITASTYNKRGVASSLPCVTDNTGGSFAASSSLPMPLAYILFDDGTKGMIYGCPFYSTVSTLGFNSTTATADEYGNLIYLPTRFNATGITAIINPANASSDFELILYSDPLGIPVAERTVAIDATQVSNVGASRNVTVNLSSMYELKPYTNYAVTIRPTTANNITTFYFDTTSGGSFTGAAGESCYAVRRLDNAGAFADHNGGTVKTRAIWVALLGQYIEQGVNSGNYRVGI